MNVQPTKFKKSYKLVSDVQSVQPTNLVHFAHVHFIVAISLTQIVPTIFSFQLLQHVSDGSGEFFQWSSTLLVFNFL